MGPILNYDLDVSQIPVAYPELESGMYSPRVATLTGGALYKFGSSVDVRNGRARTLAEQARSPWWFDATQFAKIQRYFSLDPGNLGFIARGQAAVKYNWSEMDTLLEARVARPLNVFAGPGIWQHENTASGGHVTFQAPDDLLQLFVPNVDRVSGATIYVDGWPALHLVTSHRIPSGDDIDDLIQKMTHANIIIPGNPSVH